MNQKQFAHAVMGQEVAVAHVAGKKKFGVYHIDSGRCTSVHPTEAAATRQMEQNAKIDASRRAKIDAAAAAKAK